MLAKEETVYLKSQAMVVRIVLSPGRKDEAFLYCWWGAWNPGKAPQESEMGKGLEQSRHLWIQFDLPAPPGGDFGAVICESLLWKKLRKSQIGEK